MDLKSFTNRRYIDFLLPEFSSSFQFGACSGVELCFIGF